jgi:hypothetical protein
MAGIEKAGYFPFLYVNLPPTYQKRNALMAQNSARPFTTPYSNQLNNLKMPTAAMRAEYSCYKKAYADATGAEFYKLHNWNSMLRTMPYFADQVADHLIEKYSPLESLIGEFCGAIEVRIAMPTDPRDGTAKRFIYQTRKEIKRLLHDAIDNIGATNEWLSIRIISLQAIDYDLRAKIESAFPECRWKNVPREKFHTALEHLTNSILPKDGIERANLEYYLKHLHQSTAFGKTCRRRCAKRKTNHNSPRSGTPNLLPNYEADRPINPATGLRAVRFTCPLSPDMPLSLIPRECWEWYPEFYEWDCTTAQEYAEMAATC